MTACSSAQIIQVAGAVPVFKDSKLIQLITLPVYVSITSSGSLLFIQYVYPSESILMVIASLVTIQRPLHQVFKSNVGSQMLAVTLNTRAFTLLVENWRTTLELTL